jgi:hypothetical protein
VCVGKLGPEWDLLVVALLVCGMEDWPLLLAVILGGCQVDVVVGRTRHLEENICI